LRRYYLRHNFRLGDFRLGDQPPGTQNCNVVFWETRSAAKIHGAGQSIRCKVLTMKIAPVLLFLSAAVSPLTLPLLFAQENKAAQQPDFGYLDVRREPADWPTPEVLVSQLREDVPAVVES